MNMKQYKQAYLMHKRAQHRDQHQKPLTTIAHFGVLLR